MGKREKRLRKGLESIEKQIRAHREKLKKFWQDKEYLKEYWEKQIESFEKEIEKKKKRLEK